MPSFAGISTPSGGAGGGGALSNQYSLDLDGTNDYMSATPSFTLYSVSFWIKPDSTVNSSSSPQVVLGFQSYDRLAIGAVTSYLTGDDSIGIAYGAGAFGTGNVSIPNSSWTHIIVAWQTSSQTNSGSAGYDFWVYGTLQSAASGAQSGGTVPTSRLSVSNLNIGRRTLDGAQPYAGLVDEVAFWSVDVSSDIATIYNSGVPSDLSDNSIVGTAPYNWYRMGDNNGGSGTTITDQGSGGNNGTLVNGPTFSSDVPS